MHMVRPAVQHRNLADVPVLTAGAGFRQILAEDEATGARTFTLGWPGAYQDRRNNPNFEYHSCHEEIFCLEGVVHFGNWYDFGPFGYLNHPPYWIHPAAQWTDDKVTMFIKIGSPVDTIYREMPDPWDLNEYIPDDLPNTSKSRGVTQVRLDTLPWEPVLRGIAPSGMEAKHIWDDEDTGWTTWLLRVPAGWQGGPSRTMPGGDELFIIEGDLTIDRDGPLRLTKGSYTCDPEVFHDGGETSESGCLAIRWTKGADLGLPPIRF